MKTLKQILNEMLPGVHYEVPNSNKAVNTNKENNKKKIQNKNNSVSYDYTSTEITNEKEKEKILDIFNEKYKYKGVNFGEIEFDGNKFYVEKDGKIFIINKKVT